MRKSNAKRLEDRLEHVLRVAPLDETHVQRQARRLRELVQEAGRKISGQPRDACLRQIDVRDEQGPPGRLECDMRERFAEGAGVTLHVRLLNGTETQHVLEAIFKALGVALAQATTEGGDSGR